MSPQAGAPAPDGPEVARAEPAGSQAARGGRRWAWAGLALLLPCALGLRVWGIADGLPYIYNSDENAHFVPRAIGMFGHSLNPEYFANPPAYTYLLHILFAIWFGGAAGAGHAYAAHPTEVFVLARASVAVLGTISVWLLYLVGARLFDRRVGLLAAAIEAVAFLPVFYSHLALNDVPTLAPLTLSLVGSAGVLRRGRAIDYLIAGIGLGFACATKYTGGIVLIVLLIAAGSQFLTPARDAGRRVLIGLTLAGAGALACFLAANPYALLDFQAFHAGIVHQSSVSSEGEGKLGASKEGGILYYLWSFTWGLGWAPSIAALAGAVSIWFKDRRVGLMLLPAVLLYLVFMGEFQSRYFGRWLLPVFPIVCLLAACSALQAWSAVAGFLETRPALLRRGMSILAPCAIVLVLCGQGAIYSIHSGLVQSRAHTSNETRQWMIKNIPVGAQIVLEPVVPDDWVSDIGHPTAGSASGYRWNKYPSLRSEIAPSGQLDPSESEIVNIEDYERTLSPALIPYYESKDYCWVITGSTQQDRAFADPRAVPHAIAYYHALKAQGTLLYHASPYAKGKRAVPFDFDWSFDYYPLAYSNPGPEMSVYRLHGGRCA
jgi:Dolichyl-phosphate-mannose-protein mannosyltransferase